MKELNNFLLITYLILKNMSGLYYNLALRNSDVRDKDSEKLYYCVLKNRGMVDQETFINYLSQISGGARCLMFGCAF